jgi:hypothetical protein
MELRIHHFPGGWSVSDGTLATFAATREEALRRFERTGPGLRTCRAAHCADDASIMLDGVALCMSHYDNLTCRTGATDPQDQLPEQRRWEEPIRAPRRQTATH